LATPDATNADDQPPQLSPPVTAVSGTPHLAGAESNTAVPDAFDLEDPRYGYVAGPGSWRVSLVSKAGSGSPVWSVPLSVPRGVPDSDPDLSLLPYGPYAIAVGGKDGQFIAAVNASGRRGRACAVPEFLATQGHVELLPHAGVVIFANPTSSTEPTRSLSDFWLDGYSTATGQRLWSVSTDTSVAARSDFKVSGDTVYVWEGSEGTVAAYDARTGRRLWTAGFSGGDPDSGDNGLIAAFGGQVYAMAATQSESSQVLALNAASGAVMWKRSVPLASGPSDVAVTDVGDGQVLFGDSDSNEEYLLDARTGSTLETQPVSSDSSGSNATLQMVQLAGQTAVAITESGKIVVLGIKPNDRWTIAIPGGNNVSVAVADSEVYVRLQQAGAPVYGYNLFSGKLLWTVPLPGSAADSTLVAFDGGFALTQELPGTGYLIYR
jgi:outer membrane protein assembly factor BamB